MKTNTQKRFLVIALTATIALLTALGGIAAQNDYEPGDVELVYVEWARSTAITHVAAEILDRLGHDVSILSVANAAMWSSVANRDADALLAAWLPATHSAYYGVNGEFSDDVVNLGPNYTGAKLGLVVPSYVTIDSIAELAANIDQFDGQIIGIDPGAGMMQQTEAAIENNVSGIGDFELVEGSGATMTAALDSAIDNEEWIVVTGWQPHWMFGRWDLKILTDPDGIFGDEETINTIISETLPLENPLAYQFFAEFDWLQIDLGAVLVANQNGTDPEDSAVNFVDENLDLINRLLPAGMSI